MILNDAAQRLVRRLPVVVTLSIIVVCWLLFLIFVSVKQVLLVRKDVWRFLGHFVIFNTLSAFSLLSYITAVTRHPATPDQSFAPPDARPLRPDDMRPLSAGSHSPRRGGEPLDDDDIPLRLLRNARAESSRLSASASPSGSELVHREQSHVDLHGLDDEDAPEDQELLGKSERARDMGFEEGRSEGNTPTTTVLMAKTATGGPRWCRKCDGWKPDRCHHCRSCHQCVLKMDHHCPWLNNCVGYHNYKPFILFLTYATLMCAFGAWQAGTEVYRFFQNPWETGKTAASHMDDIDDMGLAFTPAMWMLLAIVGGVFGIAVGGLGGYHWYLLLNNRTTMEDMNRSVPTALLDPGTRAVLEELGPRGSRNRLPGAWRPDHILTRPERTRLRSEAREINVYDVGWRRNLSSVMCGDGARPAYTFRELVAKVVGAAWPLTRPKQRHYGAGHFFEHDPAALQQLKALTSELRLGLDSRVFGAAAPETQTHPHLGEWTIGHSDSESE